MLTHGEIAERTRPVGDCLLWDGDEDVARRLYEDVVGPLAATSVLIPACANHNCIYVDHLKPHDTQVNLDVLREQLGADGVAIPLSNGGVTIVDASDAELVSRHVWHRDTLGYARAMVKQDGTWRLVRMHRFLLNPEPGVEVDHIDLDRLNNRRSTNLRACTRRQNAANITKYKGTSRFKGVCWHKAAQKWCVQIREPGGKHRYLGLFTNEEEAAAVYRSAAIAQYGRFARFE